MLDHLCPASKYRTEKEVECMKSYNLTDEQVIKPTFMGGDHTGGSLQGCEPEPGAQRPCRGTGVLASASPPSIQVTLWCPDPGQSSLPTLQGGCTEITGYQRKLSYSTSISEARPQPTWPTSSELSLILPRHRRTPRPSPQRSVTTPPPHPAERQGGRVAPSPTTSHSGPFVTMPVDEPGLHAAEAVGILRSVCGPPTHQPQSGQ